MLFWAGFFECSKNVNIQLKGNNVPTEKNDVFRRIFLGIL